MRKRNIRISVRLTEEEHTRFLRKVTKTKLPIEEYLRQIMEGYVPVESPSADYFGMMEQLRRIGVNLNRIARKANLLNVLDVQRYDDSVQHLNNTIKSITDTVIRPKKQ